MKNQKESRHVRLGIRVSDKEKHIIDSVIASKGKSLVDTIVELFEDQYNNTIGKTIAVAEAKLENLNKNGNVNYFDVISILGSIPEHMLDESSKNAMVYRITGKTIIRLEEEAKSILQNATKQDGE